MEVGWSLPVSAQGLSLEPRAAGTAVAALRDLCGLCCMCFPLWSLLKLTLQVPQKEVVGQTMTLFLCKVQGTGVHPSLGSFYHSQSRWGRLVPNCSQKGAQLGALATGLFLAAGFYHKLPLRSPLPFLPSLLCPFSFLPSALYPAGQTGRVKGHGAWSSQAAGQDRCEMRYHCLNSTLNVG